MTTPRGHLTVRDKLKQYEDGEIDYPTLKDSLAEHHFSSRSVPDDPMQRWDSAEAVPGPDDPHWLYAAATCEVLTDDQVEDIIDERFRRAGLSRD